MLLLRQWFVIAALFIMGTVPALAQSPVVKTAKATFAGGCFGAWKRPTTKYPA